MSIHSLIVPTFTQMLEALAGFLDKAEAKAGPAAATDMLEARLAPDMFPLADQVRFTCIQAREAVARLQGQDVPPLLPREATMDGLRSQIADTCAELRAVSAHDLDLYADRVIDVKLPNGIAFRMTGAQFVRDWALPQFYFHLVTAYAIMRQGGVDLGKPDYVRHMFAYLQQEPAPA